MGHAVEERLERVERLLLHALHHDKGGVSVGTGPGASERLQSVVDRHDEDHKALVDAVAGQAPASTSI